MARHDTDLAGLDRWLRESGSEAERVLPDLLDLPGPAMSHALAQRPGLRPGVLRLLLPLVQYALPVRPDRAHALTTVMVQHADFDAVPSDLQARVVSGKVWTAHASALRGIGRPAEARAAAGVALERLRGVFEPFNLGLAQAVEAQILHDLGERTEALRTIRRAAAAIRPFGDAKRYIETRMTETWMLLDAGNSQAAAEVWRDAGEAAQQHGDGLMMAHLHNAIGVFELRQGGTASAIHLFLRAAERFRRAGLHGDELDALRNLAEAEAARGAVKTALFHYRAVCANLLATGKLLGAALASAEILDLLLRAGRHDELLQFTRGLIEPFDRARMRANAMETWKYVLDQAAAGELTAHDVATVHDYFRELPLWPNAQFLPPEIWR